jgi:hypothetical protein
MPSETASGETRDFFISFNSADRDWAEWIAVKLESAGYTRSFNIGIFALETTSFSKCREPALPLIGPYSCFRRTTWTHFSHNLNGRLPCYKIRLAGTES